MRIVTMEEIQSPFMAPLGEKIYEMIGRPTQIGGTINHSFVHVVIPPGCKSPAHYHKVSEETYYILRGSAEIVINDKTFQLHPGHACLIMPGEIHQIFPVGGEDLHFLTISAPAWVPTDTYLIEG